MLLSCCSCCMQILLDLNVSSCINVRMINAKNKRAEQTWQNEWEKRRSKEQRKTNELCSGFIKNDSSSLSFNCWSMRCRELKLNIIIVTSTDSSSPFAFISQLISSLKDINNSTTHLMLNNIDSHYSSCSNTRSNLNSWPPRSFSLAFQHFDIIMQKTLQHKIQNYWDLFKLRKNESKSLSIAKHFYFLSFNAILSFSWDDSI